MPSTVGPMTGDRNHAIGREAHLPDVLLGRKRDAMSPLPITGLIHDEDASTMGMQGWMFLPALQATGIEPRASHGASCRK